VPAVGLRRRHTGLSAAGEAAIGEVADWDDGDPGADIDGDPRPMAANGFPGIDEP